MPTSTYTAWQTGLTACESVSAVFLFLGTLKDSLKKIPMPVKFNYKLNKTFKKSIYKKITDCIATNLRFQKDQAFKHF